MGLDPGFYESKPGPGSPLIETLKFKLFVKKSLSWIKLRLFFKIKIKLDLFSNYYIYNK